MAAARNNLFLCTVALFVAVATCGKCRKFETYNAALSSSVGYTESSRRTRVIDALRSSTADFICLQEIWQEEDMEHFIEELGEMFPHHYSAIHKSKDVLRDPYRIGVFPLKDTPCGAFETGVLSTKLGWCMLVNGCLSKSGWALGECIATHCSRALKSNSVSATCISCIFMNALSSLTEAISICTVPGSHHNRMNRPGLLVMSKDDLKEVEYQTFYPGKKMTLERGYIEAKLDTDTNVACTHLSSNVKGYLEYDVNYGNYKVQQTLEINQLDAAFKDINTVLIGDLNTGPRDTTASEPEKRLDGEFPDNYDLLVTHGFSSPYVTGDGRCTYCHDNPMTDQYPNQILDHVMVKPDSISTSVPERVYDSTNPPLSDHYGVRLQVCT